MSIETIEVAGKEALLQLDSLRSEFRKTGRYPFLIGDADEWGRLNETFEFNDGSFEDIVKASLATSAERLLSWRRDQWQEDREEFQAQFEMTLEDDHKQLLGEWSGEASIKGSVSLHREVLSGKLKKRVHIGLADVREPWMVPAVVKYGGWNECPDPHEHCAMFRYWQERWGAEIVGMSFDVIECVVRTPPCTKETAIDLAWEQYLYCADIVEQGTQTICSLASTLINGNYWYFWWD